MIDPPAPAFCTLYSFKRCPYAIRARLALAAACIQPGRDLDLREVALNAKPPELLAASAKGTVPVLVASGNSAASTLIDGGVIDQSLAIMHWALAQWDPAGWWAGHSPSDQTAMLNLIAQNDGPFKQHLDRFKYASRYGPRGLAEQQQHQQAALAILRQWNQRLAPGGWLLGRQPSLADMALLPFVRQFRGADPEGFDSDDGLAAVQHWLQRFLASTELAAVLAEPWASASPWRSPSWLYHLALSGEWHQAKAAGLYQRSTRGQSLADVGFIHLSEAHQLAATAARFYSDLPAGTVTLLALDPHRLKQCGLEIRFEPAPGSGELFPHLYGALPHEAVVWSEPWT